MKRLLILFTAIAALFAAGCEVENTDIVDNVATNEMSEVCIIAEADSDDTRVSLNGNTTYWEVGDRITVALVVNFYSTVYAEFSIKSSSDISADGKRARFYGEVPTGSYYAVTALYPAVDNPSSGVTLDRNAAKNIFMTSHVRNDYNPIFTVKAGENTEVPITFSHMMHKMDFNLSLADGYQSDDLNSDNIVIEISATSNGANIQFDETRSYAVVSNTTSTITSANVIRAYGNSPQFSTMLFPLTTTNTALTFSIYIDGEKRYEIRKPDSGTISQIKPSGILLRVVSTTMVAVSAVSATTAAIGLLLLPIPARPPCSSATETTSFRWTITTIARTAYRFVVSKNNS